MRALQLTGWEQASELRDVAEPEAKPGEVLLRIGGSGACHSDLHLMFDFPDGMLPFPVPFTLGHENAGWIEALGAGVTGYEVGQPVAVYGAWGCGRCVRCCQGMDNYCDHQAEMDAFGAGLGLDGGMAALMVVDNARHLVPLDNLKPVQAAPLTDAALTPYHSIKRALHLLVPGSTALVIGVGGLGHLAIQILDALSPAAIIAVDRNSEALKLGHEVGAHNCVAAGDTAAAEISDLTKGRGVDLVLDLVGSDDTLALGATVVRKLGEVALVGVGGGSVPFNYFSQANEASLVATDWGTLPELYEVIALAESGRLHTKIQEFSLADAPAVYESISAGEMQGRAVIVP